MSAIRVLELIEIIRSQILIYSGRKSNPPVISIITSFFNAHHYFEETYRSIMNQTMQNFEWIIVDDCSTDEASVALFNSLESRSDKIKTFRHTENKGLGAGRNTAISKAAGKYLFIMDCDDLIDPTYLEKCVLFLELHPEFSIVNSYLSEFGRTDFQSSNGNHLNEKDQICHPLMIVYRNLDFGEIGDFDQHKKYETQRENWVKATNGEQKAGVIPEFLLWHRQSDSKKKSSKIERQKNLNVSDLQNFKRAFPIRSSSYKVNNLRDKLSIDNTLNWSTSNNQILCLFPHLKMGGADRFNLDFLNILKEDNYKLTIATTQKTEHLWHENFYKIAPDIFHLPNYAHETHWLQILKYLIISRQINVVFISNSYIGYHLLPLLRLEFPNVAFIDFTHMHDAEWKDDGYPRLSRQFSRYLDFQIVPSKYLAEYNSRRMIESEGRWSVCYAGIDTDLWNHSESDRKEIRKTLKINENETVIIFPARLSEEKRPLFLVEIIKDLVKLQHSTIKVLVIGEGPLLKPMMKLVNKYKLDKLFRFVSVVSPENIRNYYSASDILLLPSEYEGISLAIYEAMAMGLSVVASDVGGQKELVSNQTGYLIANTQAPPKELRSYVGILDSLINNQDLRTEIGRNARNRIKDLFSMKTMEKCVKEAITRAIENRKQKNSQSVFDQQKETDLAEELLIMALECYRFEQSYEKDFKPLIEAKNWLETQYQNWKQLAGERELQIKEHKKNTERLLENLEELLKSRDWLETQYKNWKQTSEERENQIADLKTYIDQLIEGKNWLETQYQNWKQLAQSRKVDQEDL